MITFNDFINEYNLKNKTTSIIKAQQILLSLGLNNIGIYPRDAPFSSAIGIVHLDHFGGKDWVLYSNEKYFDTYGCASPKKLSNFIIK